MLYRMQQWQAAALTPARLWAETMQHTLSNPYMPWSYTKAARTMAAGCQVFERMTREYRKPAFGLTGTEVDGETVDVAEEVVEHLPFCDLIHFQRDVPADRADPKILVVAPMSGHYATLLRGTVEALLPDHEVYITDWRNAREVPNTYGTFDLDDYIDYLIRFLHRIGTGAFTMAVCQPSVPVMAAAALMAEDEDPFRPAGMILMGGPIDTRINPTQVNELAESKPLSWFERSVIQVVPTQYPGAGRRVYPGFIQLSGFMSMNLDRHINAHWNFYEHLVQGDGDSAEAHRVFYDEFLSVMDLPAEFYLQTIHTVFQDHALPKGQMTWRGRAVKPEAITDIALMTVEGERDDISGPGQTQAAHAICSGLPQALQHHRLQPRVGHYGIFNGRRWRQEICPDVGAFIRTHRRNETAGHA